MLWSFYPSNTQLYFSEYVDTYYHSMPKSDLKNILVIYVSDYKKNMLWNIGLVPLLTFCILTMWVFLKHISITSHHMQIKRNSSHWWWTLLVVYQFVSKPPCGTDTSIEFLCSSVTVNIFMSVYYFWSIIKRVLNYLFCVVF